jgi:hypothetical protein
LRGLMFSYPEYTAAPKKLQLCPENYSPAAMLGSKKSQKNGPVLG